MGPNQVLPFQIRMDLKGYSRIHQRTGISPENAVNVMLGIPPFGEFSPYCRGYSQHILSPTDKV